MRRDYRTEVSAGIAPGIPDPAAGSIRVAGYMVAVGPSFAADCTAVVVPMFVAGQAAGNRRVGVWTGRASVVLTSLKVHHNSDMKVRHR